MHLVSGAPFWLVRNGLNEPAPIAPPNCDVAVIGAGVTGAMLADALASRGFAVTVIDRRLPAVASTAACTGLLTYELDLELNALAAMIGEDRAWRSYVACAEAVHTLGTLVSTLPDDCGFEWRPSLYLARRRRDGRRLIKETKARADLGLDASHWHRDRVEALTGFQSHGAIRIERSASIDPVRLTRALLARAEAAGTIICPRTEVIDWTTSGQGVRIETTRGGLNASWVVFATGYETPREIRSDLVELNSTYALVTTPIEGTHLGGKWADRSMVWDTDRPYNYVRAAENGRIVIGGEDVAFKDEAWRDRLLPGKTARLEARLREMFPDLVIETEFAWAGTFGETHDSLPLIGPYPGVKRALFALGYGGNGIVYTTIATRILCNIILGEGDRDLELFSLERTT